MSLAFALFTLLCRKAQSQQQQEAPCVSVLDQ
jgi:hypothetical protein